MCRVSRRERKIESLCPRTELHLLNALLFFVHELSNRRCSSFLQGMPLVHRLHSYLCYFICILDWTCRGNCLCCAVGNNTVLQLRCTADGRHSNHSKRYKTKPTRSIQVHLADPTHHLLPFNRVAKKIQVPSAQQH